jgi:hypothetical protein
MHLLNVGPQNAGLGSLGVTHYQLIALQPNHPSHHATVSEHKIKSLMVRIDGKARLLNISPYRSVVAMHQVREVRSNPASATVYRMAFAALGLVAKEQLSSAMPIAPGKRRFDAGLRGFRAGGQCPG